MTVDGHAGWGSTTDTGNDAWFTVAAEENEDENERAWTEHIEVHTLLSYFGPISEPPLVFSHRVGKIEKDNIRRILDFYDPRDRPPTLSGNMEGVAVLVLGPWKEWPANSMIQPTPQFFDENGRSMEETDADIRTKIRVLVDPSILKVLVKGMLIGGTFVQLIPKPGFEDLALHSSTNSGARTNTVPTTGRALNETGYSYDIGVDLEIAPGWWYFHQVMKVLPGYWTEPNT